MAFSKNAFITGINGFVGKYLSELLISQGWTVAGVDRGQSCAQANVWYLSGDIIDTDGLESILSSVRPDRIFHLAAVTIPSEAAQSPQQAISVNVMGTVSLLDAVRQCCPEARVLLVGSSKQYGDGGGAEAINETMPCRPNDFYGVSKAAAEMIGCRYAAQFGMDVRFARAFNHTGPGQSASFVCSDWAKQVAEIELNRSEPCIRVGDIEQAIDFTDVVDVVRAYHLILERGRAGEIYNVCSGTAVSLKSLLAMITEKATRQIAIVQDESRVRPTNGALRITGDHSRLTRDTGWVPEIPLEKTIEELYRYWIYVLAVTTTSA